MHLGQRGQKLSSVSPGYDLSHRHPAENLWEVLGTGMQKIPGTIFSNFLEINKLVATLRTFPFLENVKLVIPGIEFACLLCAKHVFHH